MGREEKTKYTGTLSPLVCTVSQIAYLVTIGYFFYKPALPDPYMNGLVSTVAGTITCYFFGFIWSNTSVYDPYWYMGPVAVAAGWVFTSENE